MESDAASFTNPQIKTGELPRWEEVMMEPLAKAAPWELFWQTCIVYLVFGLATVVALFTLPLPFFIRLIVLLAGLFSFIAIQWYHFREHRQRGVALRDKDVLFKKGLWWRERAALPLNRVQHIEIHRGVIERKLGLSTLKLYTAGGSGVDLQISGLESDRADRMKQYILEKTRSEVFEQ
ncbi:PH domain-containing protein [Pelagicoccus sp. SDUM812003]|uniref:PH domain-containing protein n=1 Tax=Pelagicoccus sp. SDUM812003 TaxID=3041267 RepID=UPI00280D5571|nr:PH domain-containing protein [Pelagicoccus sp. SDUM812003]MDQ8205381.1 PH domain-containing protein [Pelagicoccus sp. SDUM812003]